MKFGLDEKTLERIDAVLRTFPAIQQVILYGSRAKGNYRQGSDIDLTLLGENLQTQLLYKLHEAIEDELLPYTFDISIFSQLDSQELIEHIQRVGVVFYQRQ
jgi:uncharacterized protein